MCIIAIKPEGIEFPSMDTFRTMFDSNNDGMGYMYPENGTVQIRKGFMTMEDAENEYKKIIETFPVSVPFVFHFRIGTHGARRDEGLTHPFPLGTEKKNYLATVQSVKMAFVHNGIIAFMPDHKVYSDSVLYGKKILEPLAETFPDTFLGNSAETIISNTIGESKIAVMRGNGSIEYFGNFMEENGILYSNSSFKKYEYTSFDKGNSYKWNSNLFDDFDSVGETEIPESFPNNKKPVGIKYLSADEWERDGEWFTDCFGISSRKDIVEYMGEFYGRMADTWYRLD